jgi:AsmA protein
MRKLGYTLLGIIVVIIVVLLAAPMFLNVNQYRGKIQSELQARLGRSVQLGDMHLKLLPLRVSADNVTIGEDARFHTGRPFAQAQALAVSAQLLPLLHGQLDIHSLTLERPSIELVRDASGVWNFSSLGAPAQQSQPKSPQSNAQKPGQNLSLAALDINDGTVAITDAQKHQSRAVYDHIDVSLRDFAAGKPFSLSATAHLPGQGKQVFTIDGTAGPMNDANLANTAFDGKLKLQQVAISSLNKFLNTAALKDMDANVTGEAKVKNQNVLLASDGSLRFENGRVNGTEVGFPVHLDYKAGDDLNKDIIQIDHATVKLGSTTLNVNGSLNTHPATSIADLHVVTKNANLGEIAKLTGASGSGTLDLDVRATGPMNDALQYSGSGRLTNASYQPATLTQPLKIKNVSLQFTRNGISLQNLAVSLGQTSASGQLTLRNPSAPNVDFNLTADKVDVAELQKLQKPAPPKPGTKQQQSALANVSGKGTLSIGTLAYDQLVLNNVHSTVDLDHGIIKFTPVTSQLYNGQQSGGVTVDTRVNPPTVQMALGLQNVDANKLLSSVSSVKETLYGLLAAKSQASFAVGSSAADIAKSLNGTLSLNLTNGKLAHVDLLNQLANIAKFARGTQAQPFTNLAKMTGNFNVTNGVAATNDLVAQIDGGTIAAQGTANLVNNGLNMHMTAVLGKALSQTVGGTGIGGFMNTALANKAGELVIPVIVTGTFEHPQFAPDLQKLAQMKLENLLPSTGNPAAGVLGGILGGQGGQQGAQGALGGILGALGGKQQQRQNQQNPQLPQGEQQPPQQQQQQQPNAVDLLQQMLGGKKKQQQQQQQPPQNPPPR